MRRTARAVLSGAIVGLLVASSASAQTLEQICPGAAEGTGALWGQVMNADADLMLPGASVIASWTFDGQQQRSQAQVGPEGIYAMCLPLEQTMSVYASFATSSGVPMDVTMSATFTRLDLSISMATDENSERLWLCVDRGQSQINTQFSRLVRCDEDWQPLEQCPKIELGRITVQPVGAGSGMLREMVEQLVQEANRIGANAIVNVRDGRGGQSFGGATHLTAITGDGVLIEVDPSTCR